MVLSECLERQWYGRLFAQIYPELAEKWMVRVEFDDLDTESFAQKVEAYNAVQAVMPQVPEAYARGIGRPRAILDGMDWEQFEKAKKAAVALPQENASHQGRAVGGPAAAGKPSAGTRKRNVSKIDEQDKK